MTRLLLLEVADAFRDRDPERSRAVLTHGDGLLHEFDEDPEDR